MCKLNKMRKFKKNKMHCAVVIITDFFFSWGRAECRSATGFNSKHKNFFFNDIDCFKFKFLGDARTLAKG